MTVSNLMKAILAMDVYNRGYDAGINSLPTAINTKIGNLKISTTSTIEFGNGIDSNKGFYAIAYELEGGEKVISYRGTDDVDGLFDLFTSEDVWNGWNLGAGDTDSEQGQMAVQFYQAVAGSGNWQTANISLTGHSLGGGLAIKGVRLN